MSVMKDTVDVQKQMMKENNLDDIQDVMDDMRDCQEDMNEMQEMMSRQYEVDVEDDELDAGKYYNIFFIYYLRT